MPKDTSIRRILVIDSDPIVIGLMDVPTAI